MSAEPDAEFPREAPGCEFRAIYLATPEVIDALRDDLLRAGAQAAASSEPDEFMVNPALLRRVLPLPSAENPRQPKLDGLRVRLSSDIQSVARQLPSFHPELVMVDERERAPRRRERARVVPARSAAAPAQAEEKEEGGSGDVLIPSFSGSGGARESEAAHAAPTFESFLATVRKSTPRDFHYPARRVLVVLPEAERSTQRGFHLGLLNVRGVIIEPQSSVELFLFGAKQLGEFRKKQARTSICISGGGLEGYIYSLGVAQALDDCFRERSTSEFDIYCGVSSGAILAACLAAGFSTDDLVRQLYRRSGKFEPIGLGVIFDPAGGEVLKRAWEVMKAVSTLDPAEFIAVLQRLVPVGFFRGERLKSFFQRQMRTAGVEDSFAAYPKELYISATDQDTGEHVVFGEEPWRDVKVSQAIRASLAVPPFFLPERINGHWFTDGQLTSSSDFNMAIKKGAGLVLMIDPMVAFTSNSPGSVMRNGGFFSVVQAIKSVIQTRAKSMFTHAKDVNPDVDFVLIQPADGVMEAMAGNPMKYRIRTELAELGYRGALHQILNQYDALAHKFAKHGFHLKSHSDIRSLLGP